MIRMVKLFTVAIALLMVLPVFGKKGIIWNGEWKSAAPIIVWETDEATEMLTLDFQKDLGDVVVSIMDASGNVVYQESVQTDVTPSVTISLDGLDVDDGMVSITDGENLVFGTIHL